MTLELGVFFGIVIIFILGVGFLVIEWKQRQTYIKITPTQLHNLERMSYGFGYEDGIQRTLEKVKEITEKIQDENKNTTRGSGGSEQGFTKL